MSVTFSAVRAEFLQHYQRDLTCRWTSEDVAAQAAFASRHLGEGLWLDWSSPAAALELWQAGLGLTPLNTGPQETILLAGPMAELLPSENVFRLATAHLKAGGKLIGIVPCLRDNSPESEFFARLAAEELWPYFTAEEIRELLCEAGLEPAADATGFVPIRRFNEAVLKDELGFKGFRRLFDKVEAQGYDPMEIGWGELRLVARSHGAQSKSEQLMK